MSTSSSSSSSERISVERKSRGIDYILCAEYNLSSGMLLVEAEEVQSGDRWVGEFTAQYVEGITQKTGNFKKFGVFVRMLRSALNAEGSSVSLEILTHEDLERLRSTKDLKSGGVVEGALRSNKRFAILTYEAEFDRIFYPLPLIFEDNPDPRRLKATIIDLREKLGYLERGMHLQESTKHKLEDWKLIVSRLEEENTMLKKKLATVSEKQVDGRSEMQSERLQQVEAENYHIRRALLELETKSKKALDELELENQRLQQEIKIYDENNTHDRMEEKDFIRKLRSQIRKLEEEIEERDTIHRRLVKKHEREIARYQTALEAAEDAENRLRLHVAQLESSIGEARHGNNISRRSRPRSTSVDRLSQDSRDSVGSRGSARSTSGGRLSQSKRVSSSRFDPTAYVKDQRVKRTSSAERNSSRTSRPSATGKQTTPRSSVSPRAKTTSTGRLRSKSPSASPVSSKRSLRPPRSSTLGRSSVGSNSSIGRRDSRRKTPSPLRDVSPPLPLPSSRPTSRNQDDPIQPPPRRAQRLSDSAYSSGAEIRSSWASSSGLSAHDSEATESSLHNASIEIQDIDSRLDALQRFLRDVKDTSSVENRSRVRR